MGAVVRGPMVGLDVASYRPPLALDPAATDYAAVARVSGTLTADARLGHAEVLRAHRGHLGHCLERQQAWAGRFWPAGCGTRIHAEPALSVSDMVMAAVRPLAGLLAERECMAIGCQNAREHDYGVSSGSRALHEFGARGLSFTVGHRGLVAAFQAIELALMMAGEACAARVLVTAAERWLDIYPRILGRWAVLSDGAAAAAFTVDAQARDTAWVVNTCLDAADFGTAVATGCLDRQAAQQAAEILAAMISAAGLSGGAIAVLSPPTGSPFCTQVEDLLQACVPGMRPWQAPIRSHFGSADPIMRIEDFRAASAGVPHAWSGALVWDADPNGLFGAALIAMAAFCPPAGRAQQ